MIKVLFLILISVFQINLVFAQTLCDGINEPELVRIYFINGMMGTAAKQVSARRALELGVGNTPDYEYRVATNYSEVPHEQVYELLRQRRGDVNFSTVDFWNWYNNPTASNTPSDFQKAMADIIYDASYSEFSTDTDLQGHVSRYLQDLRAGKKVVLVAHSQGNFYANNAYGYITSFYPEFRQSIGIVAIGTPASFVADGGLYTQNSRDRIIFTVVAGIGGFNVVPPNVTFTGNDPINHGFIDTYIFGQSSKIFSDISGTINRLTQPSIDSGCDQRIAEITTLNATNVTDTSANLKGRLTSGEDVDAWLVYNKTAANVICSDTLHDGTGPFTSEIFISSTISNLQANTVYYTRACAKGAAGDVSDGGLIQFITTRSSAQVTNIGASSIGHTSATLRGTLTAGSGVDVWFNWGTIASSLACNGIGYDGDGPYSSLSTVSRTISGLISGTQYKYIVCAKGFDGNTNSSEEKTFTTTVPEQPCSDQAFAGSSSGLNVVYNFGTKKGVANVGFETFTIPDKLEIFKHGTNTRILHTGGFVSGYSYGTFTVDSSFSKVDVIVTGNTNVNTKWELTINCPN